MRVGRKTKRTLFVLGTLVLLFALFHSGPVKALVQRIAVRVVASLLDGTVSVGRLDYRLWRGEVELLDVSLASDRAEMPFTLELSRVVARGSLGLHLSAEIEQAELVLIDFFDTPANDHTTLLPWIRSLRVRETTVRFQDHDERGELRERIALEDVAIDISETWDEHRIGLHSRGGHLYDEGFGPIDADLFVIPGERLRVASVSLLKDDSFVRAEGELDFRDTLEGTFDLRFALDGSLARAFDEELEIRGILAGSSRVRLEDGKPSLETELSSDAIAWQNITAESVEGNASYEDGVLVVHRLEARGFGGSARLGATISLREGARNRFDAQWSGFDAGDALPLAARFSGEATLSLDAWDFGTASGDARVQLDPGSEIAGTVRASLESGVVRLESRDATLPDYGASADVAGTLTTAGELDLGYSVAIRDISRILPVEMPVAVEGAVSARGTVEGALADPQFTAELSSDGLRIHHEDYVLSGRVTGSPQELTIEEARFVGEPSAVTARGTIPLVDYGSWQVAAELDGLVSGRAEIFGAARDPDGSAQLRFQPDGFDVTLVARKRDREIVVEELTGSIGAGSLVASGTYALDTESMDARLSLRELRLSEVPYAAPHLGGLDGVVKADATVSGSWRSPVGEADIQLDDLTLVGTALPAVTLALVAEGDSVQLRGAHHDGTAILAGALLLSEDYPLHLEAPLDSFPLTEVLHNVPVFADRERATWSMEGTASLDVPLFDLSRLEFHAQVERTTGRYQSRLVETPRFTIDGNLEYLRLTGYELHGEYNRLAIDGIIPLSDATDFELDVDGDLRMAFLELLYPELEIEGVGRFDITVRGSRDDPDIEGDIRLEGVGGRFGRVTWSDLRLTARADEDRLRDLLLSAKALGGAITLEGEMPFLETAGPGHLDFAIEDVDLAPLVDPDLTLIVSLGGRVDIPKLDWETLVGSGQIERIAARAAGTGIDTTGPAPWKLVRGQLSVPSVRLEGDRGRIDLSLASLRPGEELELEASAKGTIDAAFVNALLDAPDVRVGGLAELEVNVTRKGGTFAMRGGGSLSGGRLVSVDPEFSLAEVSAQLSLQDSTLLLEELRARAGSGRFSGEGSVDLRELARPVVDLRATAERVPLQIMDGLRAEVSGSVRLLSTDEEMKLSGNLTLDRGLLTRELDDDDASFSSQGILLSDPTVEPGPFDQMALEIVIATTQNVRVENSIAQLEAAGSVSFGGTVASPELGGFVTLIPDGTFNVGRNRFQIVQGRINLTGFPAVPPSVQIVAVTRVGSTAINADIEGDADDLRTHLTAPENPDLTEGDLASLLVTGRTLENAGEGGQQIASTWMMSSMANLVHEGLGDLISFGPPAGAGPLILAEEADPTARLSLGFPVTERMSITYSIALDNSERRLWILDYRVARNFWIRAIQENANDYSLGISQRFSLDFRGADRAARRTKDQYVTAVTYRGATEELVERVQIQSGDRYDYWGVRDEAAMLEERLINQGYKSAVVEVETTVEEGEVRDDVTLEFVVESGKPTEFIWRGDDPGGKIRSRAEARWRGHIPEDFLVSDLTRLVSTRLRADRYYLAEVDISIEEHEENRAVVFDVQRGPLGKEVRLGFSGNDVLSDRELKEALPKTDTPEFFMLLDRSAELERGLRLRYASDGYLNVTSAPPITRFDPEAGAFFVEIPIDEGPQTTVATIELDGDLSIDRERLLSEFRVLTGTSVDFPEIRRGQTRLRTLYRNEGFPDVKVRASLERSEAGLDIVIIIDEGARARVGEVVIVGNTRTHPSVVRNELTFRAADPVRLIDFQETQKRLYDLGIFRSADVRPDPSQAGQEVQDIIVQVVERADLDVNYGLRYNAITSEQSVDSETEPRAKGLEAVARVNFINQIGRGTNLGFSIFFAGNYQLFRGTFRMPTFLRRRIITELIAETERHEERLGITDFETRSDSLTFQQTKKLTDDRYEKFALQWNFRFGTFTGRRFGAEGTLRPIDTNRPRFGVSLIEDRRDSFANPTRGRFWNVTLQVVPEIWGSDVGYVRLYGQFFYYYPFTKSLVWASGVRSGVARGTKAILLMEDRFLAGGANSVRGFKQNTLGPSFVIPETQERLYVGGQAVAVLNQELRFPIYKALHGGAYVDAGNVFSTARELRLSDLRVSAGAGLRFALPFGAIRFDWAEVLNPQPMDETVRWHFSFGYAF